MKKISFLLTTATILIFSACKPGPAKEQAFESFQQLDDSVSVLYNQEQFQEAIDLLTAHMGQFPEKESVADWYLIIMHCRAKQYPKALQVVKEGNQKNYWFTISPERELFVPLLQMEGSEIIMTKNRELQEKAQREAKSETLVELPSDYSAEKSYPLFIALHGWGEDIPMFKEFWRSDLLKKEFIVLFIQSSQVANMHGFAWTDIKLAHKEILKVYTDVLEKYPIDQEQIIIGGFSQGAVTTIDLCLQNAIPSKGFIALCPGKPESFTKENVEAMKTKGLHGIILTGEKDGSLPAQQEMVAQFDSLNFPYKFIVEKNLGHWFPADLNKKIDDGIAFIREQN